MRNYIIFNGCDDYSKNIFGGCNGLSCCFSAKVDFPQPIRNMNAFHTSYSINSKCNLPLKWLWYPIYLKKIPTPLEKVIIIFIEGCRLAYDLQFHLWLKKRYLGCKLLYYSLNPVLKVDDRIKFIVSNFDYVVSFDRADCLKYGWIYYPGVYCKREEVCRKLHKTRNVIDSDVFFIGRNKNRLKEIKLIYRKLKEVGLNPHFIVTSVSESEIDDSGIVYNQPLSYEEVLDYVRRTKFLLEIVQKGQTGSTLRTFEAITYSKILITNNHSLVSSPLWDENMLLYDNAENFDASRLFEMKYHPNESAKKLSPMSFFSYIESLID